MLISTTNGWAKEGRLEIQTCGRVNVNGSPRVETIIWEDLGPSEMVREFKARIYVPHRAKGKISVEVILEHYSTSATDLLDIADNPDMARPYRGWRASGRYKPPVRSRR